MKIKEKLESELKGKKLTQKAGAVKSAVLKQLCSFAEQNKEFAQAIEQSDKTFDECLESTVNGCGIAPSDLEVYKKAVGFYFPGADIKCTMVIDLGDGGFSNEEVSSVPTEEHQSGKMELEFDSLLDF